MGTSYETIQQLTVGGLPQAEESRRLNEFSRELGWRPSDRVDVPATNGFTSTHLLVEHGLEHAAVLSFLRRPRQFPELSSEERSQLLGVAYNNLVDWHLAIESDAVSFVYVRTRTPTIVDRRPLARDNYDALRIEVFEQVVGRRPSPNVPALDDALIRTISYWKRALAAELGPSLSLDSISALFNSIIFVRALEDHHRRIQPTHKGARLSDLQQPPGPIRNALRNQAETLTSGHVPTYLFEYERLAAFDGLDPSTARLLLADFYANRFAPYGYDFSLISQHALSRIYEHYVSLLRETQTDQLTLLPTLPTETVERRTGAVYTPQFVARFFARYLRENLAPFVYKRLRSIDPACGSGIFLRTLLEVQCDPVLNGAGPEVVRQSFGNANGLDIDQNAVRAAQLSIALLHLAVLGELPQALPILPEDALAVGTDRPDWRGAFDVVVANPPFVAHDHLDEDTRQRVAHLLGEYGKGKNDLHLAFVKLGLDLLKPGGIGMFVLPHSFLFGNHAAGLRSLLAKTSWVRCLADLSAVRVFEDTAAYVILLIFEKRSEGAQDEPLATVVKVQEFVGQALQDVVEGRRIRTPQYSIFDVPQSEFERPYWTILPSTEGSLRRRLEGLPTLDQYLDVRQGVVTGADRAFILPIGAVPEGEEDIYVPVLRDREMRPYTVPRATPNCLFFPYRKGIRIAEEQLRREYPKTWRYLLERRTPLEARKLFAKYGKAWWEPMWARPNALGIPKIVAPHLSVVPKFALDERGRYAVTRAPMLMSKDEAGGQELLLFFLAVLNSTTCFWYMTTQAHRYERGYIMLEGKTLRQTVVPDPSALSTNQLRGVVKLVRQRLQQSSKQDVALEREIDLLVADLYGVTSDERAAVGLA